MEILEFLFLRGRRLIPVTSVLRAVHPPVAEERSDEAMASAETTTSSSPPVGEVKEEVDAVLTPNSSFHRSRSFIVDKIAESSIPKNTKRPTTAASKGPQSPSSRFQLKSVSSVGKNCSASGSKASLQATTESPHKMNLPHELGNIPLRKLPKTADSNEKKGVSKPTTSDGKHFISKQLKI